MANLNRIILVGRLTDNPEVRFTVEGTPLAKFRLAVNRIRRTGEPAQTDFINIVAWRRLAEICGEYLKKGRLVLVEGRLQVRSYEVQGKGRRFVTEVVARNMQMLERALRQEAEPSVPPQEEVPLPEEELTEGGENLPF